MGRVAVVVLSFFGFALAGYAQQVLRATTEEGRAVLLFPDGRWVYADSVEAMPDSTGSGGVFIRPKSSTRHVKTIVDAFSIWIDNKVWKPTKTDNPNRTELTHSRGDAYGILIAERIGMPLETLRNIVISNAESVASKVEVKQEERRKVNGAEVLYMKTRVVVHGIPFIFVGYYYSGDEGSFQAMAYTAENLFSEYEKDLFDFLNGVTIALKDSSD